MRKSKYQSIGFGFFKSTDGEKGMNTEHEIFHNLWCKHLINGDSLNTIVLNIYTSNKTMPIGEPHHFAKCARGRILNYIAQWNLLSTRQDVIFRSDKQNIWR